MTLGAAITLSPSAMASPSQFSKSPFSEKSALRHDVSRKMVRKDRKSNHAFPEMRAQSSFSFPGLGPKSLNGTHRVSPSNSVVLEISTPYDPATTSLNAVVAYGNGAEEWFVPENQDATQCTLTFPSGFYKIQVIAFFYTFDSAGNQTGTRIVVAEDIDADSSSTVNLVLDPSTATNRISASGCYPDGEKFILSKAHGEIIDGEPTLVETLTGNVPNGLTVRNSIFHKELGEMFWSELSGALEFENSDDFPDIADAPFDERSAMYINDISDNFICAVTLTTANEDGPVYIDLRQDGSKSAVLANNPADYVSVANKIGSSGLGLTSIYPKSESPLSINSTHFIGTSEASGPDIKGAAELSEKMMYCNAPEQNRNKTYRTGFEAVYEDYTISYVCDTTYFDDGFYMISEERVSTNTVSPISIVDNSNKLTIIAKTDPEFYRYLHTPMAVEDMVHPLFRQTPEERALPLGTSTVYSSNLVYTKDMELVPFDVTYYGLSQEIIGAYGATSIPSIKYNGEDVEYDLEYYSDFWSGGFLGWCYDWNAEQHPLGTMDISFSNPSYVIEGSRSEGLPASDGEKNLEGTIVTNFHFDQTKLDNVPPAVQYLQFRDSEGKITDTFNIEDGGMLRIVAGDFHIPYDCYCEMGTYPHVNKNTKAPQVSYRPYGMDGAGWTPMALTKVMDSTECFAPTYEADPCQTVYSYSDQWYDLRIYLEDGSGNYMEQIISPSFRLVSTTGIEQPETERDVKAEGVYTLSGMKIDSRNLSPGIYIRRNGEKTEKIVIR